MPKLACQASVLPLVLALANPSAAYEALVAASEQAYPARLEREQGK